MVQVKTDENEKRSNGKDHCVKDAPRTLAVAARDNHHQKAKNKKHNDLEAVLYCIIHPNNLAVVKRSTKLIVYYIILLIDKKVNTKYTVTDEKNTDNYIIP